MASPAWTRRNQLARAKGFRNYYEYRTRKTPGAAKPSREELRRRRGHAGRADLKRALDSGRVELVNVVQTGYGDRPAFDVLIIMQDGSQRSFTVKGQADLGRLRDQLDALGADAPQITGSPKGRRRLEADEELEAELAAAEAEQELGEAGDEPYTFDDSDIPF